MSSLKLPSMKNQILAEIESDKAFKSFKAVKIIQLSFCTFFDMNFF